MESVMKKLLSLILAICVIPLILYSSTYAQAQEGDYMHVDYIHIEKDKIAEFTAQVETHIKRVQQARVDSEGLKEWYMYRVAYPGSQNTIHNFVSVSICSYICSFEDFHDIIREQFSSDVATELIRNYQTWLIPNHSELWRINNNVTRDENREPARYLSMDYMRVRSGMEYAYQMMEDEIARPLHEQRMENDTMEAWQLFSLIIPGGTQYGYNYATGNHFKNLRDFEFGFTDELIRQTHPNTNINEFFENIERTREPVRIEIWELMDYVKSN
jgi:uncharacterized protein YxeA